MIYVSETFRFPWLLILQIKASTKSRLELQIFPLFEFPQTSFCVRAVKWYWNERFNVKFFFKIFYFLWMKTIIWVTFVQILNKEDLDTLLVFQGYEILVSTKKLNPEVCSAISFLFLLFVAHVVCGEKCRKTFQFFKLKSLITFPVGKPIFPKRNRSTVFHHKHHVLSKHKRLN